MALVNFDTDEELAMVGLQDMGSVAMLLGNETVPDIDSVFDIGAVGHPGIDILDGLGED